MVTYYLACRKKVYEMKGKRQVTSLHILIGFIFLMMFSIIGWGVYTENNWIETFDLWVIDVIQSNITGAKTAVISVLTEVGNIRLVVVLTIFLCLILFWKKWYAMGLWLGGTVLFCAAILTKGLKKVFDRERPDILPLLEKTTESFPSGHATASTIFYGFLALMLILLMKKLWNQLIVGFVTLVLIGFILITRIYLGVHYPTDVLAGSLYGFAVVFFSVGLYLMMVEPLQRGLRRLGLRDQSETFREDVVIKRHSF